MCGTCRWWVHPRLTQGNKPLAHQARASPSVLGVLLRLLGVPETWLLPDHLSRGNVPTIDLKGCSSSTLMPHCCFQALALTQSYFKTKLKKHHVPLRLVSSDTPLTPPPPPSPADFQPLLISRHTPVSGSVLCPPEAQHHAVCLQVTQMAPTPFQFRSRGVTCDLATALTAHGPTQTPGG